MISAANHVPLTPLSLRGAFPVKVAAVDADESAVSYAELGRDCDALAGALRAGGVQSGDQAATEQAFRDGWFHTGDLGVMHADGYIELTDRSKDIIISGGENIASVEVEKALAAHPDVLEAAVVARPDPRWGERPGRLRRHRTGRPQRARTHRLHPGTARPLQSADQVYFEALPKTSTGKIQKNVLRDRARNRTRDQAQPGAGTTGER